MAVSKPPVKPSSRPVSTYDSQNNATERRRAIDGLIERMRSACMPDRRGEVSEIGVIIRLENGETAGLSFVDNVTKLSARPPAKS